MDIEEILKTEYSEKFDELRKKAMVTSYYKYGSLKKNVCGKLTQTMPSLQKRVDLYNQTGNTELLVDIANMAMIEFMYPQHPQAHYEPMDSDKSPGLVGMSINEIKRFKGGNL